MLTWNKLSLIALFIVVVGFFGVQSSRAHRQKKTTGGFDIAVESVRFVSASPDNYDNKGGGDLKVTFRNASEKPIASLRFKQTDTGAVDTKIFLAPDLFEPNAVESYTVPFGPSGHFTVLVGVTFADGTTEGEK